MIKRLLVAAMTTAFALAVVPGTTRADNTRLAVIVFPGVPNLPIFAGQAKGFFAKRGLDIDVKFTPNSEELRSGLAEGRYQDNK
jgi:ABC-type nitrate/sulfonate/bicarbonate transport system substrate-binding protein